VRARWWLLAGTAVAVFAVDQLTKWWAVEALGDRVIHVVWTLQLRLTYNFGTAFSIAQGRGALISLLALLAVGVLLVTGRRTTRKTSAVALGLIVGGAIGNLTDRAVREGDGFLGGGVVDFIDLQWWPVFNVADAAIVVGAALMILTGWREHALLGDASAEAQPRQEARAADRGPASVAEDSRRVPEPGALDRRRQAGSVARGPTSDGS
jgi:signal peptidase II